MSATVLFLVLPAMCSAASDEPADPSPETEPTVVFRGQVVGPDGKGLAGALVRSRWVEPIGPVETEADGSFKLPLGGQRPGESRALVLEATHPDMPGYRGVLAEAFYKESDAEGVIEVRRTGTIRGRVVGENGDPIPSVTVKGLARSEGAGWMCPDATTDDSGRYEFENVAAGATYVVTAKPDGYGRGYCERFILDEGESYEVGDLVLVVADQVIEGTVVDEYGKPVAGVRVNCWSRASGSRGASTDDEGHFRLDSLVPGSFEIWADYSGPEGPWKGEARATAGDGDVIVEIRPVPMFRGEVVGPDGKAVGGARVNQLHREGFGTTTGEDGTFQLPLDYFEWPEYDLITHESIVLEAHHPDMPDHRGLIEMRLEAGADGQGTIELAPTVTIRGRVVDAEGKRIPGAEVTSYLDFATASTSDEATIADVSGHYEFTNVPKGVHYSVQATAEGYGEDRIGGPTGRGFYIAGGEDLPMRDLVLHVADKVLEGTVTDEEDNPVVGATVNGSSKSTGSRSATTDDKGRFRLETLVNEEIDLWALPPDGTVWTRIRAMAGDTDVEIVVREQPPPARRLAGGSAPELDVAQWLNCDPVKLARLRGKTIVLAFSEGTGEKHTHLVSSLDNLIDKYSESEVEIIVVLASDAEADVLRNFESVKYRVALDKPAERYRGATFQKYKVKRIPAVYVIDAQGRVRYQDIPLPAVAEAVKTVLNEQ
jgi:protocatechuate 3,4-dioxygenase beta subunit